jgi:hypothetical protein
MDDATRKWTVASKPTSPIGPSIILLGLFCVIIGTYLLLGMGWAFTIAGAIFVVLGACAALRESRP